MPLNPRLYTSIHPTHHTFPPLPPHTPSFPLVATEYQRKLSAMAPATDPEAQRMRMHMVEVLCLATVVDNYLEITRRRVRVYESDQRKISAFAKSLQESIVENARMVETHTREMDQIDANELQTLRDEISLVQELSIKGKARRKPGIRAFESDKHRQAKEELSKKVEQCQRKSNTLKDKYSRTLQMLVKVREKLTAQQSMEQALARLQSQCHALLEDTSPPQDSAIEAAASGDAAAASASAKTAAASSPSGGSASDAVLPASSAAASSSSSAAAAAAAGNPAAPPPLHAQGTIDLQPILIFEKQEADDLERLMDQHAAKMDERQQLFELMRESVYTDPVLKIVKAAILNKLEDMAADARRRLAIERHRQAIEQKEREKQRELEREALQRALIAKEEEEQERREAALQAQKRAEERDRQRKLMEKQKAMEEERRRREAEEAEARAQREAEEQRIRERHQRDLRLMMAEAEQDDEDDGDEDEAEQRSDGDGTSADGSTADSKASSNGSTRAKAATASGGKRRGGDSAAASSSSSSSPSSTSEAATTATGSTSGKGRAGSAAAAPAATSAQPQPPQQLNHSHHPRHNLPPPLSSRATRSASSSTAAAPAASSAAGAAAAPKEKALCRDFLRGACPRGTACSWLHVQGTLESQPLCKDFQRGVCTRRPCAFLHLTPKELANLRSRLSGGKKGKEDRRERDKDGAKGRDSGSAPSSATASGATSPRNAEGSTASPGGAATTGATGKRKQGQGAATGPVPPLPLSAVTPAAAASSRPQPASATAAVTTGGPQAPAGDAEPATPTAAGPLSFRAVAAANLPVASKSSAPPAAAPVATEAAEARAPVSSSAASAEAPLPSMGFPPPPPPPAASSAAAVSASASAPPPVQMPGSVMRSTNVWSAQAPGSHQLQQADSPQDLPPSFVSAGQATSPMLGGNVNSGLEHGRMPSELPSPQMSHSQPVTPQHPPRVPAPHMQHGMLSPPQHPAVSMGFPPPPSLQQQQQQLYQQQPPHLAPQQMPMMMSSMQETHWDFGLASAQPGSLPPPPPPQQQQLYHPHHHHAPLPQPQQPIQQMHHFATGPPLSPQQHSQAPMHMPQLHQHGQPMAMHQPAMHSMADFMPSGGGDARGGVPHSSYDGMGMPLGSVAPGPAPGAFRAPAAPIGSRFTAQAADLGGRGNMMMSTSSSIGSNGSAGASGPAPYSLDNLWSSDSSSMVDGWSLPNSMYGGVTMSGSAASHGGDVGASSFFGGLHLDAEDLKQSSDPALLDQQMEEEAARLLVCWSRPVCMFFVFLLLTPIPLLLPFPHTRAGDLIQALPIQL